ncbi:MAG: outer membrane lipoprotein carrier protein LolA, partial [Candidatus Adiutrix sp.]|nr:outer membrane lipoprotein carrier protein LolA [Candidatus Adiutrix sp.]
MKRFFLGLTAALLLTASPVWADEAGERLLALKAELSGIVSLSGEFVQEKKLNFLAEPLVSKGKFHFSRPDYLEWEYVEPAPSGLTVQGGRAEAWAGPPEKRVKQPEGMAEAARLVAGQVMLWMNLDPEAL